MPTVLVVDDEPNITAILEMVLQEDGMQVHKAGSGREALALLKKNEIEVAISDIMMPDISGVELLKEAREFSPETAFIMITAYAGTETAIEALQHGAYDYVTKPFKMDEPAQRSAGSSTRSGPTDPGFPRRGKTSKRARAEAVSGASEQPYRRQESQNARGVPDHRNCCGADSTVLITGESGTGKELVARAIHEASDRKDKPFVSINCSAFPETLLESELFGYMKGAFTGANFNKRGLFESAGGGSLFLDEIGDMTPAMQVKLLRVLQERKLRPLGGTSEVPIDVRVIAATNCDLAEEIKEGRFREDLYYRIAVITIQLPPLRERAEDIALLADSFLRRYAEKAGKFITGISPEAMRCLESYSWPGNVRQLENTIERAVALETTEEIQLERLSDIVRTRSGPQEADLFVLPEGPFDLEAFLAQVESSLICQALRQADGNQTLAAQRLKLTKGSFRHRLQTLQIRH